MASRSKRIRRTKKFADFVTTDDEIDGQPGEPEESKQSGYADGDDTWSEQSFKPPRKRPNSLVPLLDKIKHEPDDTCVLSTDTVVTVRSQPRKKLSYSKVSLRAMNEIPRFLLESLNPSSLRDLFGILESDEISKQFVYKCQFMPSRCLSTFKSFGNESGARRSLEQHLVEHVEDLSRECPVGFTAESVQARARRLKKLMKERIKLASAKVVLERLPKSSLRSPKRVQLIKKQPSLTKTKKKKQRKTKPQMPDVVGVVEGGSSASEIEIEVPEAEAEPASTTISNSLLLETEHQISKRAEMIEKLQSELRMGKQPYKDHCYPQLIHGRARNTDLLSPAADEGENFEPLSYSMANKSEWFGEKQSDDEEDDGVIHHDLACQYVLSESHFKTGYMTSHAGAQAPILQLLQIPKRQKTAPSVGQEVVIVKCKPKALVPTPSHNGCIVDSESDGEGESQGTNLSRPYPPMPKYLPELGTKLVIPEEEVNYLENEEEPEKWDFDNPDHIRRYAIRCMRDLRQNKGLGIRNCNVSCKICDKKFTATATLMYHYRSHANIKPFCCLLCSATFTRQHSLNYHMLIHNDATRFKCPDCGRAFRHPSHYKEHRRRHTGEQPYQCPDCDMKFKTRNSFKRHLAAKHPKLDVKNIMAKRLLDAGRQYKNNRRQIVALNPRSEHLPTPPSSGSAPDASTQTEPPATPLDMLPKEALNKRPILLKMQDVQPGNIDFKQFTRVKLVPSGSRNSPGLIIARPQSSSKRSDPSHLLAKPIMLGPKAQPSTSDASALQSSSISMPVSGPKISEASASEVKPAISLASDRKAWSLAGRPGSEGSHVGLTTVSSAKLVPSIPNVCIVSTATTNSKVRSLQLPAASPASSSNSRVTISQTPTIFHKQMSNPQRLVITHGCDPKPGFTNRKFPLVLKNPAYPKIVRPRYARPKHDASTQKGPCPWSSLRMKLPQVSAKQAGTCRVVISDNHPYKLVFTSTSATIDTIVSTGSSVTPITDTSVTTVCSTTASSTAVVLSTVRPTAAVALTTTVAPSSTLPPTTTPTTATPTTTPASTIVTSTIGHPPTPTATSIIPASAKVALTAASPSTKLALSTKAVPIRVPATTTHPSVKVVPTTSSSSTKVAASLLALTTTTVALITTKAAPADTPTSSKLALTTTAVPTRVPATSNALSSAVSASLLTAHSTAAPTTRLASTPSKEKVKYPKVIFLSRQSL